MADLDHAHVRALLTSRRPDAVLVAAVAAVGVEGLTLVRPRIDYDMPIPGILEVDGCNRHQLACAVGEPLDVYADLWGEAYDRNYGARLRVVGADVRETLWESPPREGPADPARWRQAADRLATLAGRAIDPDALREALAAGWPEPLVEMWRAMVRHY